MVSNEVHYFVTVLKYIFKYLYFTGVVLFWVTLLLLHYIPKHKIVLFYFTTFYKTYRYSRDTSRAPRRRSGVWFMNKLILFNEPVQSVRKSQQTIHSRMAMIRLQLFSSRKLTDSMIRLERVFSELNSQVKNREISWARRGRRRATAAAKSKLLMSNFRINYCNWK